MWCLGSEPIGKGVKLFKNEKERKKENKRNEECAIKYDICGPAFHADLCDKKSH